MKLIIKDLKLPQISKINLEISENGLFGIIGKNGIGKSTFFDALAGDINVERATIEPVNISYIPDIDSFDVNLNMMDYINLLSNNEKSEAIRLLKIFNAEQYVQKKLGKFSLGMKQLFVTILLFSQDSDVLIIDELFSGLDVSVKQRVYFELDKIAKNKIVLITSHQLQEIEQICQTTYLLSENGLNEVKDFKDAAKEIGYLDGMF